MADIALTVPDGQLAALDKFLDPAVTRSETADQLTAVTAWFQGYVDQRLWEMARASVVVDDPTV